MKAGMKFELYRAFHNKAYLFALFLACVIAVAQFVLYVWPLRNGYHIMDNMTYPPSLYNTALMFDFKSFFGYFYYYAAILLAAVPYVTTYYTDLREGYIKNIYIRMNRTGYLAGKYMAVFLTGGTICVIPLMLNLYLSALVIPALIPQSGTM